MTDTFADVRELLYGDAPLATFAGTDADVAPWTQFRRARQCLAADDRAGAQRALEEVITLPDQESRVYLQAWDVLRQLGRTPSEGEASRVLGVVLDVPVDEDRDTLAAYADGSARYYNHGGRAVVWEQPGDEEIDGLIAGLMRAGQGLADQIGPWEGPRPDYPEGQGMLRISLLCPGGLFFGQGPFEAIAGSDLGAPVMNAGVALMRGLISRAS